MKKQANATVKVTTLYGDGVVTTEKVRTEDLLAHICEAHGFTNKKERRWKKGIEVTEF